MTLEEENKELRDENLWLRTENEGLREEIRKRKMQLTALTLDNENLRRLNQRLKRAGAFEAPPDDPPKG